MITSKIKEIQKKNKGHITEDNMPILVLIYILKEFGVIEHGPTYYFHDINVLHRRLKYKKQNRL